MPENTDATEDMGSPTYDGDLDVGAYQVNRFFVRMMAHRARIAFGESMQGAAIHYHTAVVLDRSDAEELHRILGNLLEATAAKGLGSGATDQ